MVSHFLERDLEMVVDPAEADVVVVNTCGFLGSAREESLASIRKVAALKVKYAGSFDAKSTSWVIITSVNPPTTQVERICSIQGWNKVIVADKKTPKDWSSNGCFFLSVEDQEELEYKIHASLPYMRYERKMLGYLFAVEMGAEIILGPTPPPLFVHYRSSRPH